MHGRDQIIDKGVLQAFHTSRKLALARKCCEDNELSELKSIVGSTLGTRTDGLENY